MDIDLLRTLVAVERHGSFAAVARIEGVDPSSVSRRIAALEDALDLHMFERTTRRVRLTEAGRIYLDRVTPLIDGLEEAANAARDAVVEPSGPLRVTASVAFGERWLTPKLASFHAAYPKVEIELRLTDAVVDIVGEGIDVAFRLGPEIEGALVAAKLFDTRYRAVAAPSYLEVRPRPKVPDDLADHDGNLFALPRFGSFWRFRTKPGAPIDEVQPRSALTISNALAIRRAALDGLGVALLADWTIDEDVANGRLIDLFPNLKGSATQFDTSAWIVYPSRSYVTARLRAFIDHLRGLQSSR
ncbi:MAG: LysR family transcriptional regulator [Pseudomonadota bacterium]